MKNAKAILDKASKKGLLRRTFSPRVGDPEDTNEAKNAVYALNEADDARTTASITAAEYADAIGAITYDATPYTSRGGGRNRKNKKTHKNKNKRKNNTRKYT
jgi:1,6-anhydro-N-acetylmuramate kinase